MNEEKRAVDEIINNELEEARRTIHVLRRKIHHACVRLAQAGGFDHRDKNERILEVIGSLLSYSEIDTARNIDDAPF